jgi:thioredoxin 1
MNTMSLNKGSIIAGIALVVFVGGIYVSMRGTSNSIDTEVMDDSTARETVEGALVNEGSEMNSEGVVMAETDEKKIDVLTKGSYETYTPEKLAQAETGDVVLFFHASWCPSCRSLNSDIEANSASIPDGVHILKVDYDTETSLKQKYGVTSQHTLVQVDAAGTMITKWSGSPKLSNLVSKIQ